MSDWQPTMELSKTELQSGLDRVKFAELLIRQLPEDHDGRNTWLLRYGSKPEPKTVKMWQWIVTEIKKPLVYRRTYLTEDFYQELEIADCKVRKAPWTEIEVEVGVEE